MNEQQRLLLTLSLCCAIWFGWQMYVGEPPPAVPPPEAQNASPMAAGEPVSASPAVAQATAALPAVPGDVLPAALPYAATALQTPLMQASVRNNDAAFERLVLPAFAAFQSEKSTGAQAGESLVSETLGRQASLRVRLGDALVPLAFAKKAPESGGLCLQGRAGAGEVSVHLKPRPQSYAWDYTIVVRNDGNASVQGEVELELGLSAAPQPPAGGGGLLPSGSGERIDAPGAVWLSADKLSRQKPDKLPHALTQIEPTVQWAGVEVQYFLLAWLPQADAKRYVRWAPKPDGGLVLTGVQPLAAIGPHQEARSAFTLYTGPKRDNDLSAVAPQLGQAIDYNIWVLPMGFLARPAMWLLRQFYALTHSWGVAILLLTLVVKTLLLPASISSQLKLKRMTLLKPELDALQKRYKSDPQKLSQMTFALYKKHNANPLAGCLPTLLQLPIWLAFYRMLASAVDLYRQPFLWISDLHLKEPFPFLALAVGAVTIVQQRLTPMAADNPQARVMMWMLPAMMSVFMVNLPAGLVFYMVVNSTLTILQQLVINRLAA